MSNIILTSTEELEAIIHKCIHKALHEATVVTTPIPKELMNLAETCEYLNLAEQTIYGYTSKRKIPFIKKHKILYFKKVEIDAWLLEGTKLTQKEILKSG